MKNSISYLTRWFFMVFGLAVSGTTFANQHSVGEITIHYNVLNSADIPAEVAAQYQITRSGRTGLVNIAVQKNGQPVIANIFGQGSNRLGQLVGLAFKEVKEENAIYYLATYTFNPGEPITFELQIQPEKNGPLLPLSFKKELFIN